MAKKTKTNENDVILDDLEETLKLSPFFDPLLEDVSQVAEKALNPGDIKPISTRRPNIYF